MDEKDTQAIRERIAAISAQIDTLANERADLQKQLAMRVAPFAIGNVISIPEGAYRAGYYVVDDIRAGYGDYTLITRKIKVNGEPGLEGRKLAYYDKPELVAENLAAFKRTNIRLTAKE
jgi:hypothetical protein